MSAGAGGVTTPIPLTPADFTVETVSAGALYGSEIQSVRASPASEGSGWVVHTVDAKGNITRTTSEGSAITFSPPVRSESCWHGIAVQEEDGTVATVNSIGCTLDVYSSGTHTASFPCTLPPTQVCGLPSRPAVFALTERNQMSIWDSRSPQRSACVARGQPTLHWLYALDCDGDSVAVGGADATVYVYDARTWTLKARYVTPAKYEISGVCVEDSGRYCVTSGLDNEILAGRWVEDSAHARAVKGRPPDGPSGKKRMKVSGGSGDGRTLHPGGFTGPQAVTNTPQKLLNAQARGFRGDSRWLGLAVVPSITVPDRLVTLGLTESGLLFAADNMEALCPT